MAVDEWTAIVKLACQEVGVMVVSNIIDNIDIITGMNVISQLVGVLIGQERYTMGMESEQMKNGSMAPSPLMIDKENFTVRFNGKKWGQ